VHGERIKEFNGEVDKNLWPTYTPPVADSQRTSPKSNDRGPIGQSSATASHQHPQRPHYRSAHAAAKKSRDTPTDSRQPARFPGSLPKFEPIGASDPITRPARDRKLPRNLHDYMLASVDGKDAITRINRTYPCSLSAQTGTSCGYSSVASCRTVVDCIPETDMSDYSESEDCFVVVERRRSTRHVSPVLQPWYRQPPEQPFPPRQFAICWNPGRTTYLTRTGLKKHSVIVHGKWYRPRDNRYITIPPHLLPTAREKVRAGQSHRRQQRRKRGRRNRNPFLLCLHTLLISVGTKQTLLGMVSFLPTLSRCQLGEFLLVFRRRWDPVPGCRPPMSPSSDGSGMPDAHRGGS